MTDPIADMIIRIKNGYMAKNGQVKVPFSKIRKSIADILLAEKYVESVEMEGESPFQEIVITLRYVGKKPAVTDVKRISKPGRRVYAPVNNIPSALSGYGIVILSTNKGVMTDKSARKMTVGGEVLCSIW